MDTLLTLVIAVGGIATGIGAIWTAMLGRRQLNEQRQFLKEQNEIARRQAQLTDQSLTEQRQSFQEQTEIARRQAQPTEQSLTEQNERSRLNLEADLLLRMRDRYDSKLFIGTRSTAAKYFLDNGFVEDDMVGVERLNAAAIEVCNFFEFLRVLRVLAEVRCVVGQRGVEQFRRRRSRTLVSVEARH